MKVFIGSSKESRNELREVATWLQEVGLVPIPWDDPTLFRPGEHTFLKLIELAKEVDAAVFIFSEDDSVWYRDDNVLQPRDNILIEYGLFSGILGPTRTVICRKGISKIATDLSGIIHIDISSDSKARAQLQLQNWAKNLKRELDDLKFARLWKNRHEVSPSLSKRIELSKETIFFVGVTLESTFAHYRNVLLDALNNNPKLKVRMMMLHPDSLHVDAHQLFATHKIRDEIIDVIKSMESFYYDLDRSAKNNLDITLTHYLPRFAAKIFDNKTMLLNFYLYKSRAQENPVLEIDSNDHNEEFKSILTALNKLYNYETNEEGRFPNHRLLHDGKWNGLPNNPTDS